MAALALLPAAAGGTTPFAHPIHTSLAEIAHDRVSGEVRVSLRMFAGDLNQAIAVRSHQQPELGDRVSEDAARPYLIAAFAITDRSGERLALQWCGLRRSGDLLWACFRAQASRGLAGARVVDRVLFELFEDQINIVQASYGGRRESILFTRTDGEKPLP